LPDALYEEIESFMNIERASFVRTLRVENDYTFRALAHECIKAWGVNWPDIQPLGEDLCKISMKYFNESWADGWQ
jgi:hypothetical protein